MEDAAAGVDSRTAAIVCADILKTARVSERRLSLKQAEGAVRATPLPRVDSKTARRRSLAAKANIPKFKSLKKEMPRSEDESRKTYRARLMEQLKAMKAVIKGKGKEGAPIAGGPAVPSL